MFYNGANVKQVDVPTLTGSFGILASHVPTLQVLKPGVVTVYAEDGTATKYFGKWSRRSWGGRNVCVGGCAQGFHDGGAAHRCVPGHTSRGFSLPWGAGDRPWKGGSV